MPELNRANREVCDVDIRYLKTGKPFLFFDTANTTTAGLSADAVYAMAKGSRRIAFPNPMEGTLTIEAQVYPFKFFALLSNGQIHSDAVYADKLTVTCSEAGKLTIKPTKGTIEGAIFVYKEGQFGDDDGLVEGEFTAESGEFVPAESPEEVCTEGAVFEVGCMVARETGVKRISFTNANLPPDYFITMHTLDKDEEGLFTPFIITAYKASIQRTFELSFTSEGDPATVTLTFDLLEDKEKRIMDMVELTEDASETSGE